MTTSEVVKDNGIVVNRHAAPHAAQRMFVLMLLISSGFVAACGRASIDDDVRPIQEPTTIPILTASPPPTPFTFPAEFAIPAPLVAPTPPLYTIISPAQLSAMINSYGLVLVNVHLPFAGDIPGTDLSIPFDQIATHLYELPRDKKSKIVLYCRSGRMSAAASATLARLGYTNVFDLAGGMRSWIEAGFSLAGG
jgi:rhodanese-related sulfurtransferase